jgi:hypothetical protein
MLAFLFRKPAGRFRKAQFVQAADAAHAPCLLGRREADIVEMMRRAHEFGLPADCWCAPNTTAAKLEWLGA